MDMSIGIIGGGVMGLTLALRLIKEGYSVVVLEAAEQLGGLATWFDYGEFIWDKYYHVILRKDEDLLNLIDELSLTPHLKWAETKTGFLWNQQLISMSNHWEFLRFPALDPWQKCRLASGLLYTQHCVKPENIEHLTAKQWLSHVFGSSVYQAIWEPLLNSKYGVLIDKVPATIMLSTIQRYSSTRSKSDGKELMGYLSGGGGYRIFFYRISQIIKENGSRILCGQKVQSIDTQNAESIIVKTQNETFTFSKVISTLPTSLLSHIAPHLQELHFKETNQPEILGVIRLALVLKRPLSPYYVTNLIQSGFSFTGIIGISSMTGSKEMESNHLVMIPRYDVPNSPWFTKSEEEIRHQFISELATVWPDINNNLIGSFVHKEKMVQALWLTQPPRLSEPKKTNDGRIWSVNAELAGRDTLNNNAIVRVANEAARIFIRGF
jgi:protoporphyrinogen oxidase